MKTALKGKFITEKSFYWNLLAIAGPMAFQYAISFGVTLMDSVMLGSLGDVAISGANLGNQMQTLVMSCSFGLASGGGVLIAQYWGKKDMVHIRKVVRLTIQAVFLSVSVLTLLALAFPAADSAYLYAGCRGDRGWGKLSVSGGVQLPALCSGLMLSVQPARHRAGENDGGHLWVQLFCKRVFNYIFIFGKLGAPALGVRGSRGGHHLCALF